MKKVLLIRPNVKSAITSIIRVEPLELEYLYTITKKNSYQCKIHDCVIDNRKIIEVIDEYKPDIIGITSYLTQKDMVIKISKEIKERLPNSKIIIGGVHASLNYKEFFVDEIDIIVHSGGYDTFNNLLKNKSLKLIKGICYNIKNKWITNEFIYMNSKQIMPDRTFFYNNLNKYKYMGEGTYAILKASYSCPYNCNFCYCTLLNKGKYVYRSVEDVVEEIKEIKHDRIWIVDDTFYVNKEYVKKFIELIKKNNINKKFIIYYRSDFIARNPKLIKELRKVGVINIIVGLEAIDDNNLKSYNKNNNVKNNKRCVEILKKNDIICTGLFIIDISAKPEDFKTLSRYIWKNRIKYTTVSVLTPLPGTQTYNQYEKSLISTNYKKFNFLHLVIKPTKISIFRFYFELYKIYSIIIIMNYKQIGGLIHEYMGLLVK